MARLITAAAALGVAGLASAQTPPDAGSLLNQIEKEKPVPLPPQAAPLFTPPPTLQSLGGPTLTVTEFVFSGNTLLSGAQLTPAVAGFLGHPLSFQELQNAGIAVANVYRRAGWVVRAYLPKQDVSGGTVTIQIVEAKFGAVRVEGDSRRVSAAQLTQIVETLQPPGAPVKAEALDRALLLIEDLPGVSATGQLGEGREQAETDLVLGIADVPRLTGSVTVDDAGARYTGAARVVGDVSLNSPCGIGDRGDLTLLDSQGSTYERAAYSIPVGSRGWRIGANASHLDYRVITADFSSLDLHGTSTTAGLDATYPLLRTRLKNLYVAINAADTRFDNLSVGTTTTHYSVLDTSVGMYGNLFDTLGGGGANTASVTLVQGNVDLAGSPNEAADAIASKTAGSFQKLRFAAAREQAVTGRFSLYASLSGQAASKNLDTSERFYLGGPAGVRAYPVDEGGGAEGVLVNLEAREKLPANFNATGFVDWGVIHVNKDIDFAGAASPNSDQLKGIGVSVGWAARFGLSVKATLAHRIGSNPDPTSNGDDQDGSLVKNRIWAQISQSF